MKEKIINFIELMSKFGFACFGMLLLVFLITCLFAGISVITGWF